jgi:hypothetical protein
VGKKKIKTLISCSITFFSENRAVYEIMSKNMMGPERQQMAIRQCVACWISKDTRAQAYLDFLDRVLKKFQISDFIKIRPVGAELFDSDGLTDMTKVIVALRNFGKAPKMTAKKNKLRGSQW